MEDLIKRSDAIKVLERCRHRLEGNGSTYQIMLEMIENIPSAEKQGEWEWNQYDGNPAIGNYHCSICRRLVPHDKYAYCPNCGSKNERSRR